MSTTIDQRVVEMRFDNQNFEKNVSHTMSTLDKLKQKLHLTGASKGLEEVDRAAKKVDMTTLSRGVETVTTKFSALQVMGTTALVNITNQAVNAGKRIMSALTIDPVKTGFQEYETQINAVQTILANTSSKGTTIDDVNQALEELNKYADKTIYNFTEMTRNIGTFTAAGVDLETSTNAIQGIANLAAVSGSTSQQASTAMYQLSQALAAGTVKLMDWNSVVNAGMGGQVFQDALKETARVHGVAIDKMIEEQGSFRETLSEGWITSEILTETLQKFTLTTEGLTEAQIEQNRVMLRSKGYTEAQIEEIFKLGKTATDAATKVKTFTQLWDVIKESVQSGWAQTWKIIIGDFEEAKELLTPLAEYLTNTITKFSDARNKVIEGAFGSKWDRLNQKIQDAGFTTERFIESLKPALKDAGYSVDNLTDKYGSLEKALEAGAIPIRVITKALGKLLGVEKETGEVTDAVTMSVEELDKVARRVIKGEFGDGEARLKALAEAGYDYAEVQNKVNELLGSSIRHTTKLTEAQKAQADNLVRLTDEELRAKGYTEEQIEALRELQKTAEGANTSISDLIEGINKPSGKILLIESFKNIWEYAQDVIKTISEAWKNVFGTKDADYFTDGLYGLIEHFHELTEAMNFSGDTAENFKSIMEGVFAIFQLGGSIASKSLVGSLKILNAVLNLFGTDILGVAAKIADYIVIFNDWVKAHTMFGYGTMFDKIAAVLVAIYEGVSKCVSAFLGLEKVQGIVQKFKDLLIDLFGSVNGTFDFFSLDGIIESINNVFNKIEAWIKGADEAENLGAYLIEGLIRGIINTAKGAVSALVNFASTLWESFCTFWGIESPSKLMESAGENIVQGLLNGLKTLDWSKVSAIFWNLSALLPNAGILNLVAALANSVVAFGSGIIDTFTALGGNIVDGLINGIVEAAKGIGNIVLTIGTTIYNVIAGFFDVHSPSKKMIALGGFIVAGLIIGILRSIPQVRSVLDQFGGSLGDLFKNVGTVCANVLDKIDFGKVLAIGLSTGLIVTIKKLADAIEIFAAPAKGVGKMLSSLGGMFDSFGDGVESFLKSKAFSNRGTALLKIAAAIGVLALSVALISKLNLDWKQALVAVGVIGALAGVLVLLGVALNNFAKASVKFEKGKGLNIDGLRQNLIGIGIAILLLAATVKLISGLSTTEAITGFIGLAGIMSALLIFVKAIAPIAKDDGLKYVHRLGKMMIKFTIALALMVGVCKLISLLDPEEVLAGIAFAAVFTLFARSLMLLTGEAEHSNKLGKMMIKMAIAMGLMVGVVKLINLLDYNEMLKGAAFAAGFTLFVGLLVGVTRIDNEKKIAKLGGLLLSISSAMLIMVGVIKLISGMTADEITKGIGIMTLFGALLSGLIVVSRLAGEHAKKAGLMLIEASVAMLLMTGVLLLLSELPNDGLKRALGIITWFSLIFAGLIGMTYFARHADTVTKMLITLTIAIAVLAVAVTAMSFIDSKDLAVAAGSMTALIGVFALLIRAAGFLRTGGKTWLMAMGTIALLTVVITGFAFVIERLSAINPKNALGAAGALGILMIALSSSLAIISVSKSLDKKNILEIIEVLGALTILAGAMSLMVYALRNVNPTNAIGSATAVGILLLALSTSLNAVSYSKSISPAKIPGILKTLGALAIVAAAIGVIVYCLRNVNPINAIGSATAVGLLLLALSSSLDIVSRSKSISKTKIPGVLSTLAALAIVAAAMTIVIYALRNVDPIKAIGNANAIGLLMIALSTSFAIIASSKTITSPKLAGVITGLLLLTAAIGVIGGVIYGLRNVDPKNAIGNAVAVGILLLAMSASLDVISLSKSISKTKIPGILQSLIALAAVAAAMGLVIYGLRNVDPKNAIGNAVALGILLGVMSVVMIPLSSVGARAGNAIKGALALTSLVVPLVVFAFAISKLPDLTGTEHSLIVLSAVMTAMTLLMVPLIFIGKQWIGAMKGAVALTAMVVPLAAFATALALIPDLSGSLKTVGVLSLVLAAMTLLMVPLAIIGTQWVNAMKGAVALTTMVVPLAAFAAVLSLMPDINNALSKVGALSILLTVCTLLLIPLIFIGTLWTSAMKGAVALTAMALPMLAFVGVLALMANVENAITNASALTKMMTVMTLLLIPLMLVGALWPAAAIGITALTAMAIPMLVFVGMIALMNQVENAEANANLLIGFMTTITDLMMKLAIVGPFALMGIAALSILEVAMMSFGALATAIGWLMEKCPSLESFLNKGISVLSGVAEGLGTVLGKFVTGFANEVMTLLPSLGTALSTFMTNLGPFLDIGKTIDESILKGVGYLSGAILLLAVADFITGIVTLGGLGLVDLALKLHAFALHMIPFATALKMVDPTAIDAAKKVSELLLILAGVGFVSAIVDIIDKLPFFDSIESLGDRLTAFAKVMADFSKAITENGGVDTYAVQKAADAGAAMVKLANSIPRSEGFLQDVIGKKDLEKFGETCKAFGEAIKVMSESLTGENGEVLVNQAAVDAAVTAGKAMTDLSDAIPRSEGFLQDVIGEKDLEKFGNTCKAFGAAIKVMSDELTGDNGGTLINQNAIDAAVTAGKGMSEVAKAIPRADGFLQDVVGDKDLEAFGTKIEKFGGAIKAMSGSLTGENGDVLINQAAIDSAVLAGTAMTEIAKSIPTDKILDGKVPLDEFGTKIASFGSSLAQYGQSLGEADMVLINQSLTEAGRLATLARNVADLDVSGLNNFSSLTSVATTMSTYAQTVADMDTGVVASSITSAGRLRDFVSTLIDLDTTGISNFKVSSIGTSMKSYANLVQDLDPTVVTSSITSAGRLRDFVASLVNLDSSGLANFQLGNIGSTLKSYASSVAEIDTGVVASSISVANRLRLFISSLAGLDTSGAASYKASIDILGNVSLNKFIEAFNVKLPNIFAMGASLIDKLVEGIKSRQNNLVSVANIIVTAFMTNIRSKMSTLGTIGQNIITSIINGMNVKKITLLNLVNSIMTSMVNAVKVKVQLFGPLGTSLVKQFVLGITSMASYVMKAIVQPIDNAVWLAKNYYDDFYSAGSYLADGFANGISANSYKAAAQAAAMAEAAKIAAEEALGIKSPSRVFYKIGSFTGQGLVNALTDYGSKVYDAGSAMADKARSGLSGAIGKVIDALNSDMDMQPTIRPVVDLSNVRASAGSINDLLSLDASMGVVSNVGHISAMMNNNQNGTNGDVVSAIDKLRKDLGKVSGTTYNVNGITYDDGSAVSSAIGELLRAAQIERRV